jgi:hypothetical protein
MEVSAQLLSSHFLPGNRGASNERETGFISNSISININTGVWQNAIVFFPWSTLVVAGGDTNN